MLMNFLIGFGTILAFGVCSVGVVALLLWLYDKYDNPFVFIIFGIVLLGIGGGITEATHPGSILASKT